MNSESNIQNASPKRLTGLDGLRFMAIMILVYGHCSQNDFISIGDGDTIWSFPLPDGCLTILFVLSGFLAGYFAEKSKDVKTYYLKRATRIFPVYYFYLIIVSLAFLLIGNREEVFNDRLWCYVFSMGIIPFCKSNGILPFVHLWFVSSVALFYAIFPWIVKISKEEFSRWSLGCFLAMFVGKMALYFCFGKDTMAYRLVASSQFDCIFCGVYVATLVKNRSEMVKIIGNNRIITIIAWLLFVFGGLYSSMIPAPIRNEFFMVVAVAIILGLTCEKPLIKLEGDFWRFMGKISYDIFVMHIIILLAISWIYQCIGITNVTLPVTIITYLVATGITVFLAWLCNKYIEEPFSKINRNVNSNRI